MFPRFIFRALEWLSVISLYQELKYGMANIAETIYDRKREMVKVGTKQTRPLHQTVNSEVVCSHWTLCATRERRKIAMRERGRKNSRKKKERWSEKATANSPARDVLSGLVLRPFLPSIALIPPRVSAIYSSYFITRLRNRNTLQTSIRLSSWIFDLVLGFDKA